MGLDHSAREHFQVRFEELAAAGPDAHRIHRPDSRFVSKMYFMRITIQPSSCWYACMKVSNVSCFLIRK